MISYVNHSFFILCLNFEYLVKIEGILCIKMYVKFKGKTKPLSHLQEAAEAEFSSDVKIF